jgi:acylphosphatase
MRRIAHVLIRGRVQGVGFRAWVHHHAELNGLGGWVRNRRDGAVEAVFAGSPDLVEAMLKACRQGPAGSRVDTVETLPDPSVDGPAPDRFEVLPTI